MDTDSERWTRQLYKKQPFPDNHVDNSFLVNLRRNVNVRQYRYWEVVLHTTVITDQLSVITLFVCSFIRLYEGAWRGYTLTAGGAIFTILFYGFWCVFLDSDRFFRDWKGLIYKMFDANMLENALFVFVVFLGLSPVLRTLTEDTSSDTIWALTFLMFLANVFFFDYRAIPSIDTRYPDPLSLNAAIFASVLLASRLQSNRDVFALVMLAVELFALFPMFRRSLKSYSQNLQLALTVALVATTIRLLGNISRTLLFVYLASVLFVNLVAPYVFTRIQVWKDEIRGPWDEARVIPVDVGESRPKPHQD
ncbi:phosphatidylinositol N-acetylglucosaminyltransferase subunit C [Cladochytrium replicatum]|nr:phosphatidylinositol N-acetylglucosaminyltransferase subunit C [Cladochytrium replicatum]